MANASPEPPVPEHRPDAGWRGPLYSTLRFIAQHVRGFAGAIVSSFSIGFVLALLATGAFVLLARVVMGGWTQRIDETVLRWFAEHRTPWLDEVMLEITILGSGPVLTVVVLVASVFLWLTRHRWSVYILLSGIIGGQIANSMLKNYFDRPRPATVTHIDQVGPLSFPSGHAMTSMIVYGSIAFLVSRLEPGRRLRYGTLIVASLLILLIGTSRMYLGVHYPSDVIGGYIAGLAWIGFVVSLYVAVRFFARRRPRTRIEEKNLIAND